MGVVRYGHENEHRDGYNKEGNGVHGPRRDANRQIVRTNSYENIKIRIKLIGERENKEKGKISINKKNKREEKKK